MRWSVFISHASEDSAVARQLHDELTGLGCKTFLATRGLHGGDDWQRTIDEAAERTPFMVVLVSPASNKSLYVRGEWMKALKWKRQVIPWPIVKETQSSEVWPSPLLVSQPVFGEVGSVARQIAALAKPVSPSFFHEPVLGEVLDRLDKGAQHIAVLGLPGSGATTLLRELVRRLNGEGRIDGRILDARTLPDLSHLPPLLSQGGIWAVVGSPSLNWLSRLATLVPKARLVASAPVGPGFFEPVLMRPLDDQQIVGLLGGEWSALIREVAEVTGRSPGGVVSLTSTVDIPDRMAVIAAQDRIWNDAVIDRVTQAMYDLDPRARSLLATFCIRGGISPLNDELRLRLLSHASLPAYRGYDAQNPLSVFMLDTSGGWLVRPQVARAIERLAYAWASPRLGARIIWSLEDASEMHALIAKVGRGGFRKVLDDARTIALMEVAETEQIDVEAAGSNMGATVGTLSAEERVRVVTTWRVLAHIVQLLPPWRQPVGGRTLWAQLLSAITRSGDIDVRLKGAEALVGKLRSEARAELGRVAQWTLSWCREAIPGPLRTELYHQGLGLVPEVNAVRFGARENELWCADSTGAIHRWNWRLGVRSAHGPHVHSSEVWSMDVVDEAVVLAAADDGSVAAIGSGPFFRFQGRRGAMMNSVSVRDNFVVAGDDDGVIHMWHLIVEEGAPVLSGHRMLGRFEAGWVLGCLVVSEDEVFSCHAGGIICHWARRAESWFARQVVVNQEAWVRTIRRDSNTGCLFASCSDGKVFSYNPAGGDVEPIVNHGASVRGLALASHGAQVALATGGDDGVVRLWAADGEEISSFVAHRGMVRALDMNGSQLASAGTDGYVRVWDVAPQVHPPRLEAMDVDGMIVHVVAGGQQRGFVTISGRETSLPSRAPVAAARTLTADDHRVFTPRGEIELPTVCTGAMLSSDEQRVLVCDIGGRIYLYTWSPP